MNFDVDFEFNLKLYRDFFSAQKCSTFFFFLFQANKIGLTPFFCHNGDHLTTPPPAHCGIPPYQIDPKTMGEFLVLFFIQIAKENSKKFNLSRESKWGCWRKMEIAHFSNDFSSPSIEVISWARRNTTNNDSEYILKENREKISEKRMSKKSRERENKWFKWIIIYTSIIIIISSLEPSKLFRSFLSFLFFTFWRSSFSGWIESWGRFHCIEIFIEIIFFGDISKEIQWENKRNLNWVRWTYWMKMQNSEVSQKSAGGGKLVLRVWSLFCGIREVDLLDIGVSTFCNWYTLNKKRCLNKFLDSMNCTQILKKMS